MARIKDTPKMKTETRQCAVCGKRFFVKLYPDGKYIGGNYFHSISKCDPDGNCNDLYPKSTISASSPRSSALGYEYWECDKCYSLPDTKLPN